MLKTLTTLFAAAVLSLLFIVTAFAQAKSNDAIQQQIKSLKAEKTILLEYDKSSDYTRLMLLSDGFGGDQNKKNGLSSFTFGMVHGFNGKELSNSPDVFMLTFWAVGKNTKFAESHLWNAVIDGEILELGDARYAKKNGDNREFLNFVVSRENLQKIAAGKNVSFKIGNAEFAITAENLKMFENLLLVSNIQ